MNEPVTHLLYLHGFRSSPRSVKAQQVAQWVRERHPGVTWWCPQLPPSPREAMALVMQGISGWPVESMGVMGSSLGGFYATCVAEATGCRAVLLNPAVHPARDLAKYIGEHTTWQDPSERFFFEPGFVDELQALAQRDASAAGPPQGAGSPSGGSEPRAVGEHGDHILRPERYYAVIAQADEVLDWREMTGRYPGARIRLLAGSDHAISDFPEHIGEAMGFLGL
ncbi:MAG: YqiA/YcfP family alpha/beta fold hydrolase [Ramlibacter sp.]